MPHPRKGYLVDGQQVPGVTSITGRYKDNEKLNHWRVWCGANKLNPAKEGRKAANIGTAVHDAIERHIRGEQFEADPTAYYELPDGGLEKAKRCYKAWQQWNGALTPDYKTLEPQMTHKTYGYGGTPDAICVIADTLCVADWKTSNGIYDETAMQVAAYRELWRHEHGEELKRAYVVRVDKRKLGGEHYMLEGVQMDRYLEQFLRYLEAWRFEHEYMPVKWDEVTKFKDLGK